MSSVPKQARDPQPAETGTDENAADPPFSVFSRIEKRVYVYIASLAAFTSPIATAMYFPALNILASDLHTSVANINLTITTYMICQALAPTIVGGMSDRFGRRPAYLACLSIFIGANIGLALQTQYAALLVLRCLQSSGSSGTTALSNGVVSDLATRAERGSYIGLAALGQSLGPALGPVIGGLLTHFLGWRSIFWFMAIYAGVMFMVFVVFIPETCRNIVGNGSVPPQKWNLPLIACLRHRTRPKDDLPLALETVQKKQRPGLLSSFPILFEKESFLVLMYGGIIYAGFYVILAGLTSQLASTYHYNSIQIGLCYLPIGCGAITSRLIVSRFIDWNFRRHARIQGLEIVKSRQQNIDHFPIERVRLGIGLPLIYLGCATFIPYGWLMGLKHPPLPAALILLFFNTLTLSGAFQTMNVLIVDCNPASSAAASAANNLVRCLLGAGGVAAVEPLRNRIGSGWTSTLIALVWLLFSSFWWAAIIWGPRWREQKRTRKQRESEGDERKRRDVGKEMLPEVENGVASETKSPNGTEAGWQKQEARLDGEDNQRNCQAIGT